MASSSNLNQEALGTQSDSPKSSAFVSFRDVYEHLELARQSRDPAELKSLLLARASKLRSCSSPFPPPSEASNVKISSKALQLDDGSRFVLSDQQRDLCELISQRYLLDEVESFILLKSFLESEDKSLDQLLKSKSDQGDKKGRNSSGPSVGTSGSSQDLIADFLDAFNVFFFEERLYVLRCVAALLRIAEDDQHELFHVAIDTLALFADEPFGLRCLNRFRDMTQEPLPEQVRDVPRYSTFWAKQCLREQLALLEVVFLLYYGRLQPSAKFVTRCLEVLESTEVGRQQANAGFFDVESAELVLCIGHLIVLICVESLGLEDAMDGIPILQENETGSGRLVDEPATLERALDLLEQTGHDPTRAPLLLAWSLILNRIDSALAQDQAERQADGVEDIPAPTMDLAKAVATSDAGPPLWQRLAEAAFSPDMALFDSMISILSSPLLATSNSTAALAVSVPSALAYRAVFKGLLLSITELVRPSFLPNFEGLVTLWEAAFGSGVALELGAGAVDGVAALCVQFWESDFPHETRSAVLDTARRRWPVSFRPLVRLTKALTGHCRVQPLEAWPSSVTNQARSSAVEQACLAVLNFLAEMKTFAQVLPRGAGVALGAPYETLESSDHASVSYRITRAVTVAGTHIRLPSGTTGTTISDLGASPVIVLWNPTSPISGWKLMLDILAGFTPYKNKAGGVPDSQIFEEGQRFADLTNICPDNASDDWEEMAAEVLELFSCVISGSSRLGWSLLAHLDARHQNEAADTSMDLDGKQLDGESGKVSSASDLADITLNILQHALTSPKINSRLIDVAFTLLSLLLPFLPNEIWQTVRSLNVLIGSPGSLLYLSPASSMMKGDVLPISFSTSSALLSTELSRGAYRGLLSLLQFITALLREIQQSHIAVQPELVAIKAEVLNRSISWVLESVWPEYQSWKYSKLREKLEIGLSCIRLFDAVLQSTDLKYPALTDTTRVCNDRGPGSILVETMERTLVTQATLLHITPLVSILGSGQHLIDQLQRAGRQVEAQLAEESIEASLHLASAMVNRRRDLAVYSHVQDPSKGPNSGLKVRKELGLFESLFFEHTPVATRTVVGRARGPVRVELASAIMSYVLFPSSSSLSSEAAKLITSVCRATSDLSSQGASPPGLVGYLGSTQDLEDTVSGLINLINNPHQDSCLKLNVWTMLSAIVDSQPAMATLIITGKHLASYTESRLAVSQIKDSDPDAFQASKLPQALKRTALDVACGMIEAWSTIFQTDPALLESVLRFLDVAWSHATEHETSFSPVRVRERLFKALGDLATKNVKVPSATPGAFIKQERSKVADTHEDVWLFSHRKLCQARALRLIERDIQLGPLNLDKDRNKRASLSLETLFAILSDSERSKTIFEEAMQMQWEPALHIQAEKKLTALFPQLNLAAVRKPPRRDDFDLRRKYGDNYVYDCATLRKQLEGYIIFTGEEDAPEALAVDEGVLQVAVLNLEWSLIDVQATYLQAWVQTLESTLGRVVSEAESKNALATFEKSCLASWKACAIAACDERKGGDFMTGVHSSRMALLTVLLEGAWGRPESVHGSTADEVCEVSDQACRLLNHDLFKIEDSIRGIASPPFHRDLFLIVLLCSRRCKAIASNVDQRQEDKAKTNELFRSLHRILDCFTKHTIAALRQVVDNCHALIRAPDSVHARSQEDDLDLLVTLFEDLIRSNSNLVPQTWLSYVHGTSLLQASIDLVGRAPLSHLDSTRRPAEASDFRLASCPAFGLPILSLLFVLSSNPASSEKLALAGVTNALSSNMLSEYLEAGAVSPLLPSGERNPGHLYWVMMLSIVVRLIDNLGGGGQVGNWSGASARFIETDVQGFVRVYGAQIGTALAFSPIRSLMPSFGLRFTSVPDTSPNAPIPGEILSIGLLEEIDLLAKLFYGMSRCERSVWTASSGTYVSQTFSPLILNTFAEGFAALLQPLVHLLQHPRELAVLLGFGRGNERGRNPLSIEDQKSTESLEALATFKIRGICCSILAGLWEHSQASIILTREVSEWPPCDSGRAVIRPTMRTSPTSPASIGTLLDLATYLTEILRKPGQADDEVAGAASALEQTLGLCATQTALWAMGGIGKEDETEVGERGNEKTKFAHAGKYQKEARAEIESGLARDLTVAISSAEAAHRKTQQAVSGSSIFGVLLGFVQARLNRRAIT
ncbi:hypothetical protein IE53DRAFT_242900 [Violaceomyces palustris]|uniref:Uncharacterized protein n=1 Tax=Violaceomyces palustris TaxID=1673888 RepID=A0ACD0P4C9_9BASI|nr:hypothetical protein IE53DRAFT_242900 [Violaceomyces palustris]